jgi:hypothetical protein
VEHDVGVNDLTRIRCISKFAANPIDFPPLYGAADDASCLALCIEATVLA